MRQSISVFCYFLVFTLTAQKQYEGIVLDAEGKEPVEFVGIFNQQDHTLTNTNGKFLFSTALDSVVLYRIGYKKLQLPVNQLSDTIYLEKSLFELDEVVVTNAKTIYQKIKDSINSNYFLKPHTERFFIRALLRRNDTIVRIQDMQGKVKRKTSIYTGNLELDKNDFEIELQNMRQLGITKDDDNIYFGFPSLYNIYSESVRLNAMGPDFEVTEQPFENGDEIKVDFKSNTNDNSGESHGNYIINGKDNAILSFTATSIPYYPETIENETKYSKMSKVEVLMLFTKNQLTQRYYMNLAKRKGFWEIKPNDKSEITTFEMEIILYTTKSFGNERVKSNVNEQKDIFKLKHPYNEVYWQSQNQLLLTDEMLDFIRRMENKNSQFKVRSNLD